MAQHSKQPHDPNQLEKLIVDTAIGEAEGDGPTLTAKDPLAAELGRRGGLKGGRARAEKLTAEKRSQIAAKAAEARWRRK